MSIGTFEIKNGILFNDKHLIKIKDFSSIEYDSRANNIILMTGITTIKVKATKELFNKVSSFYIEDLEE